MPTRMGVVGGLGLVGALILFPSTTGFAAGLAFGIVGIFVAGPKAKSAA
ncbi:MAG: hypothetical protein VW362_10565 [Candidatus Nanopelagicales bacterium]